MAKFCKKCGNTLEECKCKTTKINYPMILTFIILSILAIALIYFLASMFLVKSEKPDFNQEKPNNPQTVEKENTDNNQIDETNKTDDNVSNNNNEVVDDESNTPNNNENSDNNTGSNEEDINIVTCTGYDGRTNNKDVFYLKDGVVYKHVQEIEIPEEYDTQDFYVSEQIMNGGRYQMSLSGRTIIRTLDSTMAFWEESPYKDELYRYIYKQFTEDGYTCEG